MKEEKKATRQSYGEALVDLGKENRKIGRKGNDIELAYQRSKKVISGYLASRAVVNLRFLMN